MTQLKTLKEIIWELMQDTKLRHPARIELQIRQEAIKWIKELSKPAQMDLNFAVIHKIRGFQKKQIENIWGNNNKAKVEWIKHFFNITDEELK